MITGEDFHAAAARELFAETGALRPVPLLNKLNTGLATDELIHLGR